MKRIVVVTGASAGVGRATVRAFAKEGCDIGLVARGVDGLEAARREVLEAGGRAVAVPTDVASAVEVEDAAERIALTAAPYNRIEAERIKENYLALLKKLEFEQKDGSLVDMALAERVLFEGARAQRDAWLNWPARVGPLVAADLGLEADRVTEALTEHVHKHIAQLGEPDVHFTGE